MDVGTAFYQLVAFGFIGLMIFLLIFVIRQLQVNSNKNNRQGELEKKLDKIIEILEKDKK